MVNAGGACTVAPVSPPEPLLLEPSSALALGAPGDAGTTGAAVESVEAIPVELAAGWGGGEVDGERFGSEEDPPVAEGRGDGECTSGVTRGN